MKRINVLDCTLRDGGYCNEWKFGKKNIGKIISGLSDAGVDIIECGFISDKMAYDENVSKFDIPNRLMGIIPQGRKGKLYVLMMNYGEYDVNSLPVRDESSIDGIRLAFHKKDIIKALEAGKHIAEKGYMLFLQPMVSLSYSDEEFLYLISRCNQLSPVAFYIVDSFGVMKHKDLLRLFYMVEHNLNEEIAVGFHSHNNMQLAYSNAQSLVDIRTKHNLIIDCCIYGMGRGAGNLNTELFVEYLNDNTGSDYKLKPLLTIIDDILEGFYQRNYWGYSLPNYLSASHNTHPNYASYLCDKHTLTVEGMNDIFEMMDDEKREYYDREYIENLYFRYLSMEQAQKGHYEELSNRIKGKEILLIAPGKSSVDDREKIIKFASDNDVVTISVNYEYPYIEIDYIFVSNQRRFRELDKSKRNKCIVTSNIPADMVYLQTDYSELLNSYEMVQDNAGLMAIKFLQLCKAKCIYLVGMDGYSHDTEENFGDSRMAFVTKNAILDEMNIGISRVLIEYNREIDVQFLTKEKYVSIDD